MKTRHLLGTAVLAIVAATGTTVSAGEPVRDDRLTSSERRIVREAQQRYRDVESALADGYIPVSDCVADADAGGMGFHYLNPGLAADTVVDPTAPEILVYVPHPDGSLKLGALEWWVADDDQDLGTDSDRPSLFDRLPFDGPMPGHDPQMPVHYDLHVWLGVHNPAGQLAPFNPKVVCDD
ncbi:MAG: hypothetical protein HKN41_09205 [Ilumatobacter sp.]|nr:hypothetical protein [Ilumatobacter sp.]